MDGQDIGHALALNQNGTVLMVVGMKQITTTESRVKLWGYNPETGSRLFTNYSFGEEHGTGSWGLLDPMTMVLS